MKIVLIATIVIAGVFLAWVLFREQNPATTAKLKCESAIEYFSGYDVSMLDVSRATVVGDVFDGSVNMPFELAGKRHVGICVFQSGSTKQITLDGKLLAGSTR